jgi:hypothetical protein
MTVTSERLMWGRQGIYIEFGMETSENATFLIFWWMWENNINMDLILRIESSRIQYQTLGLSYRTFRLWYCHDLVVMWLIKRHGVWIGHWIYLTPITILNYNAQWCCHQFSITVYTALWLILIYILIHYTRIKFSWSSVTSPVLWYRLPTADVPLPGFLNCPNPLPQQLTFAFHLELPPLVFYCSVWSSIQ